MTTKTIIKKFERAIKHKVLQKSREQKIIAARAAIFYYLIKYEGLSMTEARSEFSLAILSDNKGNEYEAPTEATILNSIRNYEVYREKYLMLDDAIRSLAVKSKNEKVRINCIADILKNKAHKLDDHLVDHLFNELSQCLDYKVNIKI